MAQLTSSVVTGLVSLLTVSYISKRYGVANFGFYSILLIAVALSSTVEAAQQQLMLRSYSQSPGSPSVGTYLTSCYPVFISILIVNVVFFGAGSALAQFDAVWMNASAYLIFFKTMDLTQVMVAAFGTFFLALVPLTSYALIASGQPGRDAINNIIGIVVRNAVFLSVLTSGDGTFSQNCILAIGLCGVVEIVFRLPLMSWNRGSATNQPVVRQSLYQAIKMSPLDFIFLMLTAGIVASDRLLASIQLQDEEFGTFAFVYAIVLASAIVSNAYSRSILKWYWSQTDVGMQKFTGRRIFALIMGAALAAYICSGIYLSIGSSESALHFLTSDASLYGFVLATSGLLTGGFQFLCFRRRTGLWRGILISRVIISAISLSAMAFGGGIEDAPFSLTRLVMFLHLTVVCLSLFFFFWGRDESADGDAVVSS